MPKTSMTKLPKSKSAAAGTGLSTAKLFQNGRSQAVRLPKDFRFAGTEIGVGRVGNAVLLYPLSDPWAVFFQGAEELSDLEPLERYQDQPVRKEPWVRYLLDTDTCSFIVKNHSSGIRERFSRISAGDLAISAVTWAELNSWICLSAQPARRLLSLQKMFAPISILPFTALDASFHGRIWTQLKAQGRLIGALDMLIAAHALSRGLTTVTNNVEHFGRVEGLKIENWVTDLR
jgi:tRNA(fMet)-specific endonuclease VapC